MWAKFCDYIILDGAKPESKSTNTSSRNVKDVEFKSKTFVSSSSQSTKKAV